MASLGHNRLIIITTLKIPSTGREPSASLVSQCIQKMSKCHWTLQNECRNPIINMVHAPTKVNGCTKYKTGSVEYCRLYSGNEGRTDRQTDGQMAQGTATPYGSNGMRVNIRMKWVTFPRVEDNTTEISLPTPPLDISTCFPRRHQDPLNRVFHKGLQSILCKIVQRNQEWQTKNIS